MITHTYMHKRLPKQGQKGAALVVGLILMLVLTLLAVSTMSTATMEFRMAQNMQYSENAFQAAETSLDTALASGNWSTNNPIVIPQALIPGSSGDYNQSVTTFDIATNVPTGGFSMGAGAGFAAYHFDVASIGTSNRGATSAHTQSFYIVGPGGN